MLNINLIENSSSDSDRLRSLLTQFSMNNNIDFKTHVSKDDDFLAYDSTSNTQLFFIDIQLDDQNGIDVAKRVRQHLPDVKIVFVSAFPEYVFQTFAVHPESFLRKPVQFDEFNELMLNLQKELATNNTHQVSIKLVDGSELMIPVDSIQSVILVDSDKRRLHMRTADGDFDIHGRLDSLTYLRDEAIFFKTYRNTIVNLGDIKRVYADEVEMLSGERVPLALSKRSTLLKQLIIRQKRNNK